MDIIVYQVTLISFLLSTAWGLNLIIVFPPIWDKARSLCSPHPHQGFKRGGLGSYYGQIVAMYCIDWTVEIESIFEVNIIDTIKV